MKTARKAKADHAATKLIGPITFKNATIEQLVASAYGWSNGDVSRYAFVKDAETQRGHDDFLEFLLTETSEGVEDSDELANLQEARRRIINVCDEVIEIRLALEKAINARDA